MVIVSKNKIFTYAGNINFKQKKNSLHAALLKKVLVHPYLLLWQTRKKKKHQTNDRVSWSLTNSVLYFVIPYYIYNKAHLFKGLTPVFNWDLHWN